MLFEQLNNILQNVNITILPIIIIPVTGLCCLVFYNRLGAINSSIHAQQKDLRDLYITPPAITKEHLSELITTVKDEQGKLLQRAHLVRLAIVSCFSGLVAFILSAISIILGIFWSNIIIITLLLWISGALLFATGLVLGIIEIKSPSLQNIKLQTALLDSWMGEE